MPWKSNEQVTARVATRIKRQEVFDKPNPPYFWAIIDEAAIKRPVGDDACMREQLTRLLQEAGQWGTRVQVLPFSQREHSMMGGSLSLLTLKNNSTLGYVESFRSAEPVGVQEKVLELIELFDVARSKALPEKESLDLIHHYLKREYGNENHP